VTVFIDQGADSWGPGREQALGLSPVELLGLETAAPRYGLIGMTGTLVVVSDSVGNLGLVGATMALRLLG